jgi:hypothetical protein
MWLRCQLKGTTLTTSRPRAKRTALALSEHGIYDGPETAFGSIGRAPTVREVASSLDWKLMRSSTLHHGKNLRREVMSMHA